MTNGGFKLANDDFIGELCCSSRTVFQRDARLGTRVHTEAQELPANHMRCPFVWEIKPRRVHVKYSACVGENATVKETESIRIDIRYF